jgi:hypothetical protein
MAVLSDGNPYQHLGIPEGLIFSFPVICSQGTWQIVEVLVTITASTVKRASQCCALFETVPDESSMLFISRGSHTLRFAARLSAATGIKLSRVSHIAFTKPLFG